MCVCVCRTERTGWRKSVGTVRSGGGEGGYCIFVERRVQSSSSLITGQNGCRQWELGGGFLRGRQRKTKPRDGKIFISHYEFKVALGF